MVLTRELQINEIDRIGEIQRKEEIRSHYKLKDGILTLVDNIDHVNSFDTQELTNILDRQRKIKREGGLVLGAFEDQRIVGVVSVENKRRGFKLEYCKMDILYVSYDHRQLGIGKKLVDLSKEAATNFGASKLYISATPTANTVDFYLRLGAVLTTELDLELYQNEPDDIHLELKVDL
jgi:predicted N-acetyltransferase YhbS